ncbi:hypothetical protein EYZ11_005530 [Aspergillus tanneri]|uniref:Uncharacterized protein n=1 Tax=Aspergillus tanneri TaxID=1220188 RepID=A0A4S3JK32_9EURO|nr:uncharacterized protein ATNIH1004_005162 [Aspergillus tanneri]KAA8649262.1 hypothetical protein ATNIH1004_005162 [Aspergillus tanneri]THC94977.1 hypothetical protein EYZ11_005530 [Aspergillus tanneri]
MSTRPLCLVTTRNSPSQRAHFAVFVPSTTNSKIGTTIQVVGAPMVGYTLEFKRNDAPMNTTGSYTQVTIGQVHSDHVRDAPNANPLTKSTPINDLEVAASQVPPPRISQNFMAPVNDTTNKRCQEWTMEYVRHLVAKGFIAPEAIEIVQSKRDPPTHGIGLLPVTY